MATRPVTWQLDVPPSALLERAARTPPAAEIPSLHQLRSSLMAPRLEFLKISTFAFLLLVLLGVVIHGSHLANSNSQFAADADVAMRTLAAAVSNQTVSIRGKIEALAPAATHNARSKIEHEVRLSDQNANLVAPTIVGPRPQLQTHTNGRTSNPVRITPRPLQERIDNGRLRDTSLRSYVSADRLAAGALGLAFYILFVCLLVRKRGGLRAFSRGHAV